MSVTKYTTPAELLRGATFGEDFETNALVEKNGGTLGSAVGEIKNGITIDATYEGVSYDYNVQHSDLAIIIDLEELEFKSGSYQIFATERSASGVQFEFGIDNTASATAKKLYFYGSSIQTSSATFSADVKQIAFTLSGTTGKFFADGQQLGTSITVSVGTLQNKLSIGTAYNGQSSPCMARIKKVFISKAGLSNQEILDNYSGATYNYRNEALVDLTMEMEQHDPDNNQTLDVSGNGNNVLLGDGSTSSTFPTKMSKKGYSLDGITDYFKSTYDLDGQLSGSTFTIAFLLKLDSTSSIRLLESTTDANNGILIARTAVGDLRFFVKTGGANKAAKKGTQTLGLGYHSIIATYDNSLTEVQGAANIYVDSLVGTGANDVAGLDASNPSLTFVGSTASGASNLAGDILEFKIFDSVLTKTQIDDLHLNMMDKFNDI